jgi:hypothetical protein
LTYRIWLDDRWQPFELSDIKVTKDALPRWRAILEAILKESSPERKPPLGFNNRIAKHLNNSGRMEGVTPNMIKNVRTRIARKVRQLQEDRAMMPAGLDGFQGNVDKSIDRLWDLLNYSKQVAAQEDQFNSEIRKLIIISDQHGSPHQFLLSEIAEEIERDPAMDVDLLNAGDTFNCFATAPARALLRDSYLGPRILSDELDRLLTWYHVFTKRFPFVRIKMIAGNHDEIAKLFPDKHSAYPILKVLRTLLGQSVDPVHVIANKFPQISVEKCNIHYIESNGTVHEDYVSNRFLYLHGDVLISHLNKTGANAHRDLWSWVKDNQENTNLGRVRLCAQGHTHRQAMESMGKGHNVSCLIGFAGNVTCETYRYLGADVWPSNTTPGFIVAHQERDNNGSWRTILHGVRGPRMVRI